jgi:hypothetical protein
MRVMTAMGVVDGIIKAGLSAPDPRDATALDCVDAGCDQSVVTDTVSVKSFATTGQAELYAMPRGLRQAATIVVAFRPGIPDAEQLKYWTQIQILVR